MYCDANSAQAEEPSCHVFHRRFSQQGQVSYWEMSEKIITSARFEDKSFTRSSFFSKMPSVVATTVIEHEPNDAAFVSNETFRFVRPVSQSKEADHGAAQATENMVGCVNDEVSSERWMEHDVEAPDCSKAQEDNEAQTSGETHAAKIELIQSPGEATVWSVMGCLGEEATSDGRVGRGGGGNEGLGEGGEENWFQKLFATAIGISLPTHSQLQVFPAPSLHPSFGSTLHPRTHSL